MITKVEKVDGIIRIVYVGEDGERQTLTVDEKALGLSQYIHFKNFIDGLVANYWVLPQ